jgi:hypothetical protein
MMKWSSGVMVVALVLAACGGEDGGPKGPDGVGDGGSVSAGTSGTSGAGGKAATAGAAGKGGAASAGASSGGAGNGGASHAGASSGGAENGGSNASGADAGGTGSIDDGGDGSIGGQIVTPAVLVPLVNAFCATARTCCEKQYSDPIDLDDCEAQFGSRNETVPSLLAGAVELDAQGLEACRAAYAAAATSCEMNPVLQACAGVGHGTRGDGESCHLGSECGAAPGPNTCLITEVNSEVGVCAKVPHATVGQRCTFTCRKGEICNFTTYGQADSTLALCFEDESLFCDYEEEQAKCQPIRATGANCEDDDQCGSQGYCDFGGDGKCKARGQLNQDCGICVSSLTCVEGKCKSPPFASFNTCEGRSLGPY